MQSLPFPGRQVAGPLSQGTDDGPLPAYHLLGLPAELHEVMADHPNDIEAVGYYVSIEEAFADDGSVAGAQVHDYRLYFFSVFVPL